MKIVTILVGVILILLLCSIPARGQYVDIAGAAGTINFSSSINGSGSLSAPTVHGSSSPGPNQFRVVVISGSEETFEPSSFMVFDQAVALGSGGASHPVFMTYDQAVQKGRADLNATHKTLGDAAREYRSARRKADTGSVHAQTGPIAN